MIFIQKFQANNHLAVIFPPCHREQGDAIQHSDFIDTSREWTAASVLRRPAVTENKWLVSLRAQRGNPLPKHRSSIIASSAWRSIAHIHDIAIEWTATSALSLLAVKHTSIIVIVSGAWYLILIELIISAMQLCRTRIMKSAGNDD